ncbi:hypothetical protein K458DRAFT_305669 [Lentithecium fluviatile CBS 122367]|uniref:CST complex subunit Ten1 n=1 Tax=Lentithecium fluviatile CBS 122367 TaxID=1168545 RepID=A0A6G1IXS7_9PLEO|nr:hypothetical protein K458DRAFT_305669 [Lentithecium fluviatile CBS 122367]
MYGPVASNLVLLGELGECAPGTKVRFLGCVHEYVIQTATLRLKHDYPHSDAPKITNVNIEHVLESIKRTAVDVGAWINVIGYVERRNETGIFVQAVAVWDAGNVDLEAYEQAVEKRKESG